MGANWLCGLLMKVVSLVRVPAQRWQRSDVSSVAAAHQEDGVSKIIQHALG